MPKRSKSLSPADSRRSHSDPGISRTPSSDDNSSCSSNSDSDVASRSTERPGDGQPRSATVNSRKRRLSSRSGSEQSDHDNRESDKKRPMVSDDDKSEQSYSAEILAATSSPVDVKSARPILLVLDTNILLKQQGLDFLDNLVKDKFNDVLPNIQVLIPHTVFLELDGQKTRHRSPDLAYRARCACRFLADNICDSEAAGTSAKPASRITGQTLAEYEDAAKKHAGQIADDHILFCCLQQQEKWKKCTVKKCEATVVLSVTNDRILRCRCTVNGVKGQSLGSLLDNIERRRMGRDSLFDWSMERVNEEENKENQV